jgi:hypothetical protein
MSRISTLFSYESAVAYHPENAAAATAMVSSGPSTGQSVSTGDAWAGRAAMATARLARAKRKTPDIP